MSLSLIIRRTHMYAALFMAPWVLMYALSTLVMNHHVSRGTQEFRVIDERAPYPVEVAPGEARNAVARRILADLDLEGRHGVWGSLEDGPSACSSGSPRACGCGGS